ncbi:MAG: 50S ribosomal protein L5, partial [Rhodospirillaceae bacterium]|nr:50S ribosomal protein L5 [Rhodospirillaceae bacterium]
MSSPRLYEHYKNTVRDQLKEAFDYVNPNQIPRLEKIVLNMGVGEATQDRKKIDGAVDDMTRISGQKPLVTRATR